MTDVRSAAPPRGRRWDWRDSVRSAADLAILGFAVTLAALPVVTAGAAVAAGSAAVRHFLTYDRWPPARASWGAFRRRLVPGLLAGPAALVAAALVVIDVAALRHRLVPGGPVVLTAVLVIAVLAAGYGAVSAVLTGTERRGAARAAANLVAAHPTLLAAAAGVVAVAAVLALFVHPALVPILPGYLLYALHVVTARFLPAEQSCRWSDAE